MISPYLKLKIAEPSIAAYTEAYELPPRVDDIDTMMRRGLSELQHEVVRKSLYQELLLRGIKKALAEYRGITFTEEDAADLTRVPTDILTGLIHDSFSQLLASPYGTNRFELLHPGGVRSEHVNRPVLEIGKAGIKSVAATIEAAVEVADRDLMHLDDGARRRFVVDSAVFVKHWAMLNPYVDGYLPYVLGDEETVKKLADGKEIDPFRLNVDMLEVHEDFCLSVREGAYEEACVALDFVPLDISRGEIVESYLGFENDGVGCPVLPVIPNIYHAMLNHKLGKRNVIS